MHKKTLFCSLLISLFICNLEHAYPQVNFNANDLVHPYNGGFRYGSNMAYYENWTDSDISDLLTGNPINNRRGIGANSVRPALYENFCEKYGYDSRVPFFKHYQAKGASNNVVFIGDRPLYVEGNESETHMENAYYCKDKDGNTLTVDGNKWSLRSKTFKNLYAPIWIEENGAYVINKENIYAYYVYRLVEANKEYIKFYEIKNEPDFTFSNAGNKEPGDPESWWDKDPDPQSLYNLHAPIQSYIRMLRISYEVIKTLSPDSYVCVGGIGYVSFLDAILRNTDNPDGGKETSEYPFQGGAWFDCLSYHIYPMYYLRKWYGYDTAHPDGFEYFRHSDAAVEVTLNHKKQMEDLLAQYGYDGKKYPLKEVILTETNVPNKPVKIKDNPIGALYIGGEAAQRNYLTKLAVAGQKENLKGMDPYCPGDSKEQGDDGFEYDYKGFYYPLPKTPDGEIREHESAKAWRNITKYLEDKVYDPSLTADLNLSDSINGAAFRNGSEIVYALWAKTDKDQVEEASAEFTFPDSTVLSVFESKWDEQTGDYITNTVSGAKIQLSGSVGFYMISDQDSVRVTDITLDHKDTVIIKENKQMIITGTVLPKNSINQKINWNSSDTTIATVSDGIVTGIKTGITDIIATSDDGGKTAHCFVKVTIDTIPIISVALEDSVLTLLIGSTYQLTPIFSPSNATIKTVGWTSNVPNIVEVDSTGLLTAVNAGKTAVSLKTTGTNKWGQNLSRYCNIVVLDTIVSVTDAIISHPSVILQKGETFQLSETIIPSDATEKRVSWASNVPNIVEVDSTGLLTAVNTGATAVSLKTTGVNQWGHSIVKYCNVIVMDDPVYITDATISHSSVVLQKGETFQLSEMIMPSDATEKSVVWTSNDPNVAEIDNNGLLTALGGGNTEVLFKTRGTDQWRQNLIKYCNVTVVDVPVYITNAAMSSNSVVIKKGETYQLSAIINPSNATEKSVAWISNAPNTVKVDNNGLLTGINTGKTAISFRTLGTNQWGTDFVKYCSVTVVENNTKNSNETDIDIDISVLQNVLSVKSADIINTVNIYDYIGNIVKSVKPADYKVTVSNLPKGILFLHIETKNGGIATRKIQIN